MAADPERPESGADGSAASQQRQSAEGAASQHAFEILASAQAIALSPTDSIPASAMQATHKGFRRWRRMIMTCQ